MNRMIKRIAMTAVVAAAALSIKSTAVAKDTDEWNAHYKSTAENKVYAQQIVDEVVAAHPELDVFGLHTTPKGKEPTAKGSYIVSCNTAFRIGKIDDDMDWDIYDQKQTVIKLMDDRKKYEVLMILRDAAGTQIGLFATIYKLDTPNGVTGDDVKQMLATSTEIRDLLMSKIQHKDDLFKAR